MPAAAQGFADEFLVEEGALHIRRVEEVDSEIERPVNGRYRFVIIRFPIEFGHPHAAKPHGGYHEALIPKFSLLHVCIPRPSTVGTISIMDDLNGRVALVTGSSRDIGRAIALSLAGAGAGVAINFRSRQPEAQAVEQQIIQSGRRCTSIQADVSNPKDVERLVKTAEERLGPIEILVNNAGISRPQPIEEITERDWDELIAVNLKSCFLVTHLVLPGMRARKWGRIINLSSVAAQIGGVVGPHYAASKAGILGLTHYYASRFAKEGITVNAIAPALVATEMVLSNPNARPDHIPVGRYGLPAEVAEVAVLLAANGYVTGQTINVNGGWFMS